MYFDSYATGKRIQQLRKANGMTQEEMAIRLNISDRHLGRIERGECAASIDLMVVTLSLGRLQYIANSEYSSFTVWTTRVSNPV